MSYFEVEDAIANGAKVTCDTEREGPYIVAKGEWTDYDNERSLCSKLAFAKSRNLRKGDNPLVTLAGGGGAGCSGFPTPTPTSPTPRPPTPPTPTPPTSTRPHQVLTTIV